MLKKFFEAFSKQLWILISVQMFLRNKRLLCQYFTRAGKRPVLSPIHERKSVRMFMNNAGTNNTQAHPKLQTVGTKASLSTVKRVLHRHGIPSPKSTPSTLTEICSCLHGQAK
ncbi:hypothetical protein ATANTOWER_027335 [Ataeniobius toweri]|uniref:Transposase Tc1-like domain-containing protein n=1 Tax=Ataeniobius toweri TaxID=208326 RepID=A0ABU7CG39_9TELE|nr:hypothetical protein [Ataeniobius toweri]